MCVNTFGSHLCLCLPGYTKDGNGNCVVSFHLNQIEFHCLILVFEVYKITLIVNINLINKRILMNVLLDFAQLFQQDVLTFLDPTHATAPMDLLEK